MVDAPFRTRRRLFLAGIETVPGTEEALTPAANAIKAEAPLWSSNFNIIRTNEATSKLDDAGALVGAGSATISAGVFAKGSGTAGVAPEQGALWRAGGLAQTLLAADITGTATAGGVNTITVPDAANMRVGQMMETTAGAGSGQARVIRQIAGNVVTVFPDWATNPDATTQFAVRASTLYAPADVNLELATGYVYDQPLTGASHRLRKVVAASAEAAMTIPAGGLVRTAFTLNGKIPSNPADVADPGQPTFDTPTAPSFLGVSAYLGDAVVKFSQTTLNMGNTVSLVQDPAEPFGFGGGVITARNINGQINPRQLATATRDEFADFQTGTPRELWFSWGTVAGNRISVFAPEVRYTGANPDEDEGVVVGAVPFEVVDGNLAVLFW